jgi:hypothetical protein
MMTDSPQEFSTTTPRRGETGTAPQVGTLANRADFFEQAPNRIPSFPKPPAQTLCNRSFALEFSERKAIATGDRLHQDWNTPAAGRLLI